MPRMPVGFEITGVQAAVQALRTKQMSGLRWFRHASERLAKTIFERSQVLVPVSDDGSYGQQPGYLKESGGVRVVQDGDARFELVVGYGLKYKVFYAVLVHERPASHKFPTQWKYLETAVQQGLALEAGRRNKNVITESFTEIVSVDDTGVVEVLREF